MKTFCLRLCFASCLLSACSPSAERSDPAQNNKTAPQPPPAAAQKSPAPEEQSRTVLQEKSNLPTTKELKPAPASTGQLNPQEHAGNSRGVITGLKKPSRTWPPGDEFWEIRRFAPGDPAIEDAKKEKYPRYPSSEGWVQKYTFSKNAADFDAHCLAEEKAGRIGLLTTALGKYALCVKSAAGVWVAIPNKPILTSSEVSPIQGNQYCPWPYIGDIIVDENVTSDTNKKKER